MFVPGSKTSDRINKTAYYEKYLLKKKNRFQHRCATKMFSERTLNLTYCCACVCFMSKGVRVFTYQNICVYVHSCLFVCICVHV